MHACMCELGSEQQEKKTDALHFCGGLGERRNPYLTNI